MKGFYNLFQKILKLLVNLIFILQIVLTLTVFTVTMYWLMSLLGQNSFDFALPLADFAASTVHIFFNGNINGGSFDGTFLVFDIAALLLVFIGNKLKMYIYGLMEDVYFSIEKCNRQEEDNLNEDLQKDYEKSIRRMANSALLLDFELKSLFEDMNISSSASLKEAEEQVLKTFYNDVRPFGKCARTGNRVLIMLNDFKKTDSLLKYIDESLNKIRKELRSNRCMLNVCTALETYDADTPAKKVYELLSKLINLKIKNEIVCFGNFRLRYELELVQSYLTVNKGIYTGVEVWALVKKD
ncbi:MAG: hypothetical protein LBK53_00950 [Heliobacteriaceae bacterium]|jgi:hypothetical protein|nr:hypothetical protein [Heliobacteriaceae bacterium]